MNRRKALTVKEIYKAPGFKLVGPSLPGNLSKFEKDCQITSMVWALQKLAENLKKRCWHQREWDSLIIVHFEPSTYRRPNPRVILLKGLFVPFKIIPTWFKATYSFGKSRGGDSWRKILGWYLQYKEIENE